MIGNLNSIIKEIENGKKISQGTLAPFLKQAKAEKEIAMHTILLHFVQNPGEQSLEDVTEHLNAAIRGIMLQKNSPIKNQDKELRTHMNFKGEGGNTLLHQAVISDNIEAIETLLKYGANPLIKNEKGKIPLDLAQGKTRDALVNSMTDLANSKKWSAVCNSSFGVIPGVFLGVGLGIGSALAGPSMVIILGAAAVFTLVAGIAVGLAIYFLSQDREQVKAIEKAINSEPSSAFTNGKEAPVTADGKGR
ncbi:ankyrin repeat domain-containing protein [Wolbachia endosymbiont of Cimex lectularius]|uniref:ankyrin repeat domain-containing protein n=1 Tax=Wolbachia endosymbiont of Cimex lectularius TaxID=246273 RepID=UPI00049AE05D|nr:ankyrin repeat domain-containing protein [Wolbachia endosymbiont of Cimex lectularius]BAO99838.1 ankyrin repeat-containing protein [Wolbachia endosymbiont of Cimex lectularius]